MAVLHIRCRSSGTHLRCSRVRHVVVNNCRELKVYCDGVVTENQLTLIRDELENYTQYSTHAHTRVRWQNRAFVNLIFFLQRRKTG